MEDSHPTPPEEYKYERLFPNYERPEPHSITGYFCMGYCCFLHFFGIIFCVSIWITSRQGFFAVISYKGSERLLIGSNGDKSKYGLHFLLAGVICIVILFLTLLCIEKHNRKRRIPEEEAKEEQERQRKKYLKQYEGSSGRLGSNIKQRSPLSHEIRSNIEKDKSFYSGLMIFQRKRKISS